MSETERRRDDGASLRLTAAALRLGEFSIRELSEAASANYETARDFVARRRNAGILVPADEEITVEAIRSGDTSTVGRPPIRFGISESRRHAAEEQLKAIRSGLADVSLSKLLPRAGRASSEAEDEIGPLSLFERAVGALASDLHNLDVDLQARLAEIEILQEAAETDALALTVQNADRQRILRFGRRLGAVTARYEQMKQPSWLVSKPARAEPSEPAFDLAAAPRTLATLRGVPLSKLDITGASGTGYRNSDYIEKAKATESADLLASARLVSEQAVQTPKEMPVPADSDVRRLIAAEPNDGATIGLTKLEQEPKHQVPGSSPGNKLFNEDKAAIIVLDNYRRKNDVKTVEASRDRRSGRLLATTKRYEDTRRFYEY